MNANTIWTTGTMLLSDKNVRFEISEEDLSRFDVGETIEITAIFFDKERKTFTRRLKYSRDFGTHFTWDGWPICYEDFKSTLANSIYAAYKLD